MRSTKPWETPRVVGTSCNMSTGKHKRSGRRAENRDHISHNENKLKMCAIVWPLPLQPDQVKKSREMRYFPYNREKKKKIIDS